MIETKVQTPPLLGIAPEILDAIVGIIDQSTWRDDVRKTFKALRETCRELAYSPSVLEKLFVNINLHRTPGGIRKLQELHFEKIAPHVQKVTFLPSEYDTSMTRENFEEIINAQILERSMDEEEKKRWDGVDSILGGKEDVQHVIDDHYHGISPFLSQGELDEAYGTYVSTARDIEALGVVDIWTDALMKMKKCATISVRHLNPTYDRVSKREEIKRCEVYYSHPHDYQHHKEGVCDRIHGTSGNALFADVVTSIARSRIRPKEFRINHFSNGASAWNQIAGWTDLDLSELQVLEFHPADQHCEDELAVGNANMSALASLQRSCVSTLRTLEVGPGLCEMLGYFPRKENLIQMPALIELNIGHSTIHLSNFAKFVSQQQKLQKLTLEGTGGKRRSGAWRAVWDAIRNHPCRMHLSMDQVPCNEATEISTEHWTGDPSSEGVDQEQDIDMDDSDNEDDEYDEDAAWEDIERSFENYVSNKGPWNPSMVMWFGDAW